MGDFGEAKNWFSKNLILDFMHLVLFFVFFFSFLFFAWYSIVSGKGKANGKILLEYGTLV